MPNEYAAKIRVVVMVNSENPVGSYRVSLDRVAQAVGRPARSVSSMTGHELDTALGQLWSGAAPATWNRQVPTVRSFVRFCQRQR